MKTLGRPAGRTAGLALIITQIYIYHVSQKSVSSAETRNVSILRQYSESAESNTLCRQTSQLLHPSSVLSLADEIPCKWKLLSFLTDTICNISEIEICIGIIFPFVMPSSAEGFTPRPIQSFLG